MSLRGRSEQRGHDSEFLEPIFLERSGRRQDWQHWSTAWTHLHWCNTEDGACQTHPGRDGEIFTSFKVWKTKLNPLRSSEHLDNDKVKPAWHRILSTGKFQSNYVQKKSVHGGGSREETRNDVMVNISRGGSNWIKSDTVEPHQWSSTDETLSMCAREKQVQSRPTDWCLYLQMIIYQIWPCFTLMFL